MDIFIFDATSVALWNYENYTSIPNYQNDKRVLYGFIRKLYKLISEHKADKFIIVDDQYELSPKNKLLKSYKQNQFIPKGVYEGLEDLKDVSSALGIERLSADGLDGLDFIASVAKECSRDYGRVYMISCCDLLDQCTSQGVKRLSPAFVLYEKEYFYKFIDAMPEVPISRKIDYFILNGYWQYAIPDTYNDLGLTQSCCKKIASEQTIEEVLQNNVDFDLKKHRDKIEIVRQLTTVNSDVDVSFNLCLSNVNTINFNKLLEVSSKYGLDKLLLKEFPRGTAYPPNKMDKDEIYENHQIIGCGGEFALWSIKRLAEFDRTELLHIYEKEAPYARLEFHDLVRKALRLPSIPKLDHRTVAPQFVLQLTEPGPNNLDYEPSDVTPNERKTYIYGLYDPREPGIIRYIGKANDPQKRLKQHIKQADQGFVPKEDWIYSLLQAGVYPEVQVIEEVKYQYDFQWGDREIYYIQKYSQDNLLYNSHKGGEDRFCSSPYRIPGSELDQRFLWWKKNPTHENQDNLWKTQLRYVAFRITLRGGSFCKYCFSYIPHSSDDTTYNDLLPYPPLTNKKLLWKEEELKHSKGCVWWKTGVIGNSYAQNDIK